jgi:tetratricopeptide (TPR) repeat protein
MPSCRQAFGHFQLLLAIVISRACSLCSQSVETEHLYREAPAADERGDSAHAIDLYKRFLKAHPESVEARGNLGVALSHLGKYDEAVAQYREALKYAPGNPVVVLNLAIGISRRTTSSRTNGKRVARHRAFPKCATS